MKEVGKGFVLKPISKTIKRSIKMKCLDKNCNREMQRRNGKFGYFYYCPVHGTISEKAVSALREYIRNKAKELTTAKAVLYSGETNMSPPMQDYDSEAHNDILFSAIEKETAALDIHVPDLVKFYIDYEDPDDEGHWMNARLY
jgi:hypothetical protein